MTEQDFKRIALNDLPAVNGWLPLSAVDTNRVSLRCAERVTRSELSAVFCDIFKVLSEPPSVHLAGPGQLNRYNQPIKLLGD